ncbi:MAG: ferredoxin reductase family protein [Patescibacteria group bacterium]
MRILAPFLFLGNLIAIVVIWVNGDHSNLFVSIGRLFGLLAFYLILWQLFLIGRIEWIEKVWGHDVLSRLHHKNGLVAWGLLGVHPILMLIGYGSLPLILSLRGITFALIGYGMFLIIVPISFSVVRRRLPYQVWYLIHFLLYGAILLVFWHQLFNGSDLQNPSVRLYWQALFYFVLASVLYYRFAKPTIISLRQQCRVTKIERETHDVISIYISGNLNVQPGQFIIVRFLAPDFWYEAHPFTVSGLPLRITPKAVGDYTSKLPNLPIGTRVLIEGPLGRFMIDRAGNKPVLFIAGGIGVTPLRALFEKFHDAKFIYTARSDQDFALKDELDVIGKVDYFTDRLTPEIIKSAVPDVARRFVYLCGPPPMMKAVIEMLTSLGVPRQAILYEKFELG